MLFFNPLPHTVVVTAVSYSSCVPCYIDIFVSLVLAEYGEDPGHGGTSGDQGQGGADWGKSPRPQTQESAGGEGVWTTLEGKHLSPLSFVFPPRMTSVPFLKREDACVVVDDKSEFKNRNDSLRMGKNTHVFFFFKSSSWWVFPVLWHSIRKQKLHPGLTHPFVNKLCYMSDSECVHLGVSFSVNSWDAWIKLCLCYCFFMEP